MKHCQVMVTQQVRHKTSLAIPYSPVVPYGNLQPFIPLLGREVVDGRPQRPGRFDVLPIVLDLLDQSDLLHGLKLTSQEINVAMNA